jgi:hypothetical protein
LTDSVVPSDPCEQIMVGLSLVIPASGLFAPCCFPALPCSPASLSLLFALGRNSSNSLPRNDFQLMNWVVPSVRFVQNHPSKKASNALKHRIEVRQRCLPSPTSTFPAVAARPTRSVLMPAAHRGIARFANGSLVGRATPSLAPSATATKRVRPWSSTVCGKSRRLSVDPADVQVFFGCRQHPIEQRVRQERPDLQWSSYCRISQLRPFALHLSAVFVSAVTWLRT